MIRDDIYPRTQDASERAAVGRVRDQLQRQQAAQLLIDGRWCSTVTVVCRGDATKPLMRSDQAPDAKRFPSSLQAQLLAALREVMAETSAVTRGHGVAEPASQAALSHHQPTTTTAAARDAGQQQQPPAAAAAPWGGRGAAPLPAAARHQTTLTNDTATAATAGVPEMPPAAAAAAAASGGVSLERAMRWASLMGEGPDAGYAWWSSDPILT